MKIFFFPKYSEEGPSSRYRIYQYQKYFTKAGIFCEISPLMGKGYIKLLNNNMRPSVLKVVSWYVRRVLAIIFRSNSFDIIYIQAELFPYIPSSIAEFWLKHVLKKKVIIDFDDAIFHRYDMHNNKVVRLLLAKKIPKVIKHADMVISGSPYLTKFCLNYNSRVKEIPTSLDVEEFIMNSDTVKNETFVVGWIGSSSTSKYLLSILDVFREFQTKYPSVLFRFIGFNAKFESHFEGINVEFIPWNEKTQEFYLRTFDVGIMPLDTSPWSKGKCGFKLIQYMAAQKPTISTPLDANLKIDRGVGNLFASNRIEWFSCLEDVFLNNERYKVIGRRNQEIVCKFYRTEKNARTLTEIFYNLLNEKY